MDKKVRDLTVMVDVLPADKLRLKEFMKQELHYYNSLVEGLGPRARTFPQSIIGLHKDWENLWETLALYAPNLRTYERALPDVALPAELEPHRKMLVGRDAQGKRFLDEKMLNIMSLAALPVMIHPHTRRAMAMQMLEFYKDQSQELANRNDQAVGEQDLYSKPIDLLVKHDMVTKRHLQIPRSALNDVRYDAVHEVSEIYHPYSENPIKIQGYDLESNNHWNWMMIHQQAGVEAVASTPWVVDIRYSPVPYQIRYQDVEQPKTGRIFATMKRRSY